jgi:hypothetical protein
MRMAEYYQKYFPRYDLYDKKIIKFKSKQFYFESNFNGRLNLKKWLKEQPEETAREYCINFLKHRKETRNLKYTPSQVEMRTLMFPPIPYIDKLFGDYYETCEKLGLESKHKRFPHKHFLVSVDEAKLKEYTILIDTREQKPLKFEFPVEVATLSYGDYAFRHRDGVAPHYGCLTYVERKSITDFIGTMSGGLERFKKEIERAASDDANLIVLVEESLNTCRSFNYQPHVSKKIRATPEFVFHNVRSLLQEYSNVQFLFVKNRAEASRVIQKIFINSGSSTFDLQLMYDTKKI